MTWHAAALIAIALGALVAIRWLVLLRNALRLSQQRHDRSEARFRQLVEHAPAVIIHFALGDARPLPVYVSPQVQTILGLSVGEVLTPGALDARIHPDDLDALSEKAAELRFTRPDGREIWLRDVSGVIVGDGGERLLQAMLVDVTEEKLAASDRERMERELQLSQKLEAVGQLAAGIAHEINTPIQFVGDTLRFLQDAFTDLLELTLLQQRMRAAAENGLADEALFARVREAEEQADLDYLRQRVPAAFQRGVDGISRVATIVRAMRDFAHPPTAEQAPVDVLAALGDALIVATNAYKYVAEVETDYEELPDVMGNVGELNQVFLNLVINAAHAIESIVGESGERGVIRLRARNEGEYVGISISDTGCGIPTDIAARVFDPFFTTKEVGRGTGQGLAIARTMVVERHGGSLTFESEPGFGTTFHVRLPVHAVVAVL